MNGEQAGEIQKKKSWKRRLVWTVLLLVIGLGVFAWLSTAPKEPVYKGKTLSYWLTRVHGGAPDPGEFTNQMNACKEAVQHIGTNAIPVLLRKLTAKDSSLKLKLMELADKQDYVHLPLRSAEDDKMLVPLGFVLLGDLGTNAIPSLIDIYRHPPSEETKEIANHILMQFYPAPSVADAGWVPSKDRAQWYLEAGMLNLEPPGISKAEHSYSNAIMAFSQAVKLDPKLWQAYSSSAAARFQLHDFAGTIMDCNKLLEVSPKNETGLHIRGLAEFASKDFKKAEADLTECITLETNNVEAYNYRGLARANLRRFNDALADFNKAIELNPQEGTGYRNRAIVEGTQRDFELALEDVSRAIQMGGRDAAAYLTRGRLENALKDYETALDDFNKVIEMEPANPTVYASRASTYLFKDDFKRASADLEKSFQLNPSNALAFVVRGLLKMKKGDEDDGALADLKRANELSPQSPETYEALGALQYKMADWPSALENCRKALQKGNYVGMSESFAYIWIMRAQSGEKDAADVELKGYLKSIPSEKTNEWNAITGWFFTGSVTESNYLALATTSAKRPSAIKGQVCESYYNAGMKRKISGDKQGAAELLQKCLDTKYDNSFAYMNAIVEMRALKQP